MRVFALLALVLLASCADDPTRPVATPAPHPQPSAPIATTPPPTPAHPPMRYVILCSDHPCGSSVTTFAGDGTVTNVADMHENGRGPGSKNTWRVAADGTLASFEAHGHQEMGTALDETFSLEGGHAKWTSQNENGARDTSGPTFFLPMALAETDSVLVAALRKNGGHLALLPSGEARMEAVGAATVSAGGREKHLTAQAITGPSFVPSYMWTEDDGTFFGEVWDGGAFLPEGWEGVVLPLREKQIEMRRARDAAIAQRLLHKAPPAGFALTHARVLDVEQGKWVADQTVLVGGEVIKAIGPSKALKVPEGAEVIDLGGKALLPGLWDMHAHYAPQNGALDIASGVTTSRDVGNMSAPLDDYKKRFDDGTAIGPHLLRAGFVEGIGPDASHSEVTVENEQQARDAVAFFAKRGYEMMKIYNSVKVELVPVITKEAHARGMTVTGHIPVHMLASEAVKAGYDGIEHVNMLFLNFLADHDTDTRTTLRFSLVCDKAADLDLRSKPVQDFFALLRDHHTVVDPTVATFENLFVGEQGKVSKGVEWLHDRLPPQVARAMVAGGLPHAGKEELYKRSWDKVLAILPALRDAKVTIVTGTDEAATGLMLDHELELFVRGGLTTAEALRDATIVPARAMKLDRRTGSIAVGKAADMFVVDGDPLAQIGDVRNVVMTFRAGVEIPSKELFETVGVGPWR